MEKMPGYLIFALSILFVILTRIWGQLECKKECMSTCQRNIKSEYDFIVVGGGISGTVIASRLSQYSHVNVLLLEAGDDVRSGKDSALIETPAFHFTLWNTARNWNFKSERQENASISLENNSLSLLKGKGLGGTSIINSMLFLRMCSEQVRKWDKENLTSGWNDEELQKYYKNIEDVVLREHFNTASRGSCGPIRVTQNSVTFLENVYKQLAVQAGFMPKSCADIKESGFCVPEFTIRSGRRENVVTSYINSVHGRPNLDIVTGAFVEKVLVNGKTVTGVQFIYKGKKTRVAARKEVILAAGAYNNPQILMMSGVGPSEVLKKAGIPVIVDVPNLGKGLKLSVIVPLHLRFNKPTRVLRPSMFTWPANLLKYATTRSGLLGDSVGLEGILFKSFNMSPQKCPDVTFFFVSSMIGYSSDVLKSLNISPKVLSTYFRDNSSSDGFTILIQLNHPKSSGYVSLSNRTKTHQHPKINPQFLRDFRDIKMLLTGIKYFEKEIKTLPAFADVLAHKPFPTCSKMHDYRSDAYWECYIRHMTLPAQNPSSTLPMGHISHAPVDSSLRLKYFNGLRVTGSTIVPSSVGVDTMATSIVISEKLFDIIVHHWNISHKKSAENNDSFPKNENNPILNSEIVNQLTAPKLQEWLTFFTRQSQYILKLKSRLDSIERLGIKIENGHFNQTSKDNSTQKQPMSQHPKPNQGNIMTNQTKLHQQQRQRQKIEQNRYPTQPKEMKENENRTSQAHLQQNTAQNKQTTKENGNNQEKYNQKQNKQKQTHPKEEQREWHDQQHEIPHQNLDAENLQLNGSHKAENIMKRQNHSHQYLYGEIEIYERQKQDNNQIHEQKLEIEQLQQQKGIDGEVPHSQLQKVKERQIQNHEAPKGSRMKEMEKNFTQNNYFNNQVNMYSQAQKDIRYENEQNAKIIGHKATIKPLVTPLLSQTYKENAHAIKMKKELQLLHGHFQTSKVFTFSKNSNKNFNASSIFQKNQPLWFFPHKKETMGLKYLKSKQTNLKIQRKSNALKEEGDKSLVNLLHFQKYEEKNINSLTIQKRTSTTPIPISVKKHSKSINVKATEKAQINFLSTKKTTTSKEADTTHLMFNEITTSSNMQKHYTSPEKYGINLAVTTPSSITSSKHTLNGGNTYNSLWLSTRAFKVTTTFPTTTTTTKDSV